MEYCFFILLAQGANCISSICIKVRCWFKSACPVSRPVSILKLALDSRRAYLVKLRSACLRSCLAWRYFVASCVATYQCHLFKTIYKCTGTSKPNELLAIQTSTLIRFMFFCVFMLWRYVIVAFLCPVTVREFYTIFILVFVLYYLCSPKFINKYITGLIQWFLTTAICGKKWDF